MIRIHFLSFEGWRKSRRFVENNGIETFVEFFVFEEWNRGPPYLVAFSINEVGYYDEFLKFRIF